MWFKLVTCTAKMPVYICAVADCDSVSSKAEESVHGWVRFPNKADGIRKSLWETRCKRGPKWRASKHHAICSKHFIDWCQGPSPTHPDPELFAYNNWGLKQYVRRNVYKRQRGENARYAPASSCHAASENEINTNSSHETSLLQAEDHDHSSVPNPVMYHTLNQDIQATVEISSRTEELDTPLIASKY